MHPDTLRIAGTTAVMALQLGLPLALGVRQYRLDQTEPKPATAKAKRNTARGTRVDVDAEKLPALAPLSCRACHAPVPLEGSSFPCPHCASIIEPPEEYRHAFALRQRGDAMLVRAERLWRRSRIFSSRLVTWPARLGLVAWCGVVLLAAVSAGDLSWPWPIPLLAFIMTIVQGLIGFAFVAVLDDARKQLPRVPPRRDLAIDAALAACAGCTSPLTFDKDRLAATCAYCGGQNYRAALALTARDHAAAGHHTARGSLLEQVRALDERARGVLDIFSFLAIAEVFYAVIFTLGAVYGAVADFVG